MVVEINRKRDQRKAVDLKMPEKVLEPNKIFSIFSNRTTQKLPRGLDDKM